MNSRRKLFFFALVLAAGLVPPRVGGSALLEGAETLQRKPLQPPDIVRFDPREDYSPDYLEAVAKLTAAANAKGFVEAARRTDVLTATLARERLLLTASEILDDLRSRGLGPDSEDTLWRSAEEVEGFIRAWSYLRPTSHPLEVAVDAERHLYRLRWNEGGCDGWCEGRFDGVEIPFPPAMELRVEARLAPGDGGRYGYLVENHRASAAPIRSSMWLESRDFTNEHLAEVGRLTFPQQNIELPSGSVWVMYPKWGAHFRISVFDRRKRLSIVPPGSSFEIAPVLSLPFESLPAVLGCWLDIVGYDATREIHEEPENAIRGFSQYKNVQVWPDRTVRVPRFAYHGKTIGPAPAPPADFTREQFIDRLAADLETGRQSGWIEAAEAAWFRDRLEELKTPGDGAAVDRVLERVVSGSRDGKLLNEAEILLQLNLEYLRKRYVP